MKTILLSSTRNFKVLVLALLVSSAAFSQTVPELIFSNPVLVDGVAGENGAKYRFNNVTAGLDAVVEIKSRSDNDVLISSIDSTGIGWDKAFQPILGINGSVAANRSWWMKFRMTFYEAGTNKKKKISKFFATGLDIDGDGQSVREWVKMDKIKKVAFSQINSLSDVVVPSDDDNSGPGNSDDDDDKTGEDHQIIGPVANYANIDTSATSVMATYEYEKKDVIEFQVGAETGAIGSPVAMRMNSIWFKQFDLTPHTLPVKLTAFNAMLINNSNKVDLSWTTSSERMVNRFEVEKSLDGKNYEMKGIVLAAGNSDAVLKYQFADNINLNDSKIVYYRLKSVDENGKFEYSAVRVIRIGGEESNTISLLTYPNPVVNELRITIPNNWQGKKVTYDLVNANGQIAKRTESSNGSQTETINMSSVSPGLYIVSVTCDGSKAQQKVIKK